MPKLYDVVAGGEKYKDREGNEKTRWLTIGVVLQTERGLRLKIESTPIGWNGWAMLSEPKQKDGEKPPTEKPKGAFDDMEDDLPWK